MSTERDRQQIVWGLTFVSPVHTVSCVLASLELPASPWAVLPQAAATRTLLLLAGETQRPWHPQLPPPLLRLPSDVVHSPTQPGRQTEPAQGSSPLPGRCTDPQQGRRGVYSAPVLSAVGMGGSVSPQAVPVVPMGPLLLHAIKASTSSHHCYYISTHLMSIKKQLLGKKHYLSCSGALNTVCNHGHCKRINARNKDVGTIPICSPVHPLPSNSFECASPVPGPARVWKTPVHCQGVQPQRWVPHCACSWVGW